jgi:glycosyltransferase involved in cell wall biosynthesis
MIVDVFPPGICGVGDYSACLARAMSARGVGVRVLTKAVDGAPRRESVDGFEVCRLAGRWSFADLRPVLEAADALGPAAIVHVQYPSRTGYHRRPMINLLPALVRIARPRHPVVVTMHEYHEHRLRWRARVLPMLLGQSAVVAVRNADYHLLAHRLRLARSPVALVPVASNIPATRLSDVDRRAIRQELGLAEESLLLAFFGDVRPDKGVHSLLDASQAIRAQGLDVRVLVISTLGTLPTGPSPYESAVLARIEAGRQSGWVMLARGPGASRVASLLGAADLAVFPFTLGASENRTSLLAATANGLPVLTTRGPSTPPGYEAAYGVATVPAGDDGAMIQEVARLVRRPEARAELRRKALAAGHNQSWDKVAEQTIALYRKCRKC